tara:strand:+ start:539 stop:835 length:297 start_codon:yes stop_codon:yes gene_type:complete
MMIERLTKQIQFAIMKGKDLIRTADVPRNRHAVSSRIKKLNSIFTVLTNCSLKSGSNRTIKKKAPQNPNKSLSNIIFGEILNLLLSSKICKFELSWKK